MSSVTNNLNFYTIDQILNFIGTTTHTTKAIEKVCYRLILNDTLVNYPKIRADLWLMVAMCNYQQQSYGESFLICRNIIQMHGNDPWICMIASGIAALCLDDPHNSHIGGIYARHALRLYEKLNYK